MSMKAYKSYMDAVEASPALHRRLTELSAPRRARRWQRYGSLAAALVLAAGLGAFGLGRLSGPAAGDETGEITPDIAVVTDPAEGTESGETLGGYEVREGDLVSYVMLPDIAYGEDTAGKMMDIEYHAPAGSTRREVTAEDVITLAGGQTALTAHLNWGSVTGWSGQGIFLEDGSLWQLTLWGEGEDLVLSLELLAGDEVPPNCVIQPSDTVTDVQGVPVKGYTGGIYGKTDERTGETVLWLPESRTVEFAANGAGYRFRVYGPEGESARVEELASRFVRLAIAEGLNLAMAPAEEAALPAAAGERGTSPAYDPGGREEAPA